MRASEDSAGQNVAAVVLVTRCRRGSAPASAASGGFTLGVI